MIMSGFDTDIETKFAHDHGPSALLKLIMKLAARHADIFVGNSMINKEMSAVRAS
jgi:hypothetical protein